MSFNSYILGFVEGILTFISPCILPLLPVYFVYLAGEKIKDDASSNGFESRRLITNSIGFVIGFTIVFVVLGAAATSLGHFLKENIDFFRKLSGIIMIIFGLNFLGIINLGFLNKDRRINYKFKELKFINSIIFGAAFGFGWTPCVGAFLGSALLIAGNSDTIGQGILLLVIYSAGLGIPFIISSIIFDKAKIAFKLIQKHNRIINLVSGTVLIIAGLLVYFDKLKYISISL
ncbi:MAG TPA: cytochrome c biogenesis protein CcdA [Clostridiaceae bacterium]|nr:cytochrome c biogenesis protein CcdA [Clostridiaceae bacterium]